MNIREAKEEIIRTVRAYTAKDDRGCGRIPSVRQRPVLLIGPPGIGKTAIMEQAAEECGVVLSFYQSNDCSSVVQTVLEAGAKGFGGIVFNPAAWVDTGAEIAGALKQSGLPIVEVHMSNICKTADSHNVIAPSVTGLVTGFGEQVYSVGLKMLAAHLRADN